MNHDLIRSNHQFERWSETYERSFMQWLLFDRVHRAVLGAIPDDLQPKVVLDIGCGTGRLLRKVGKRWPDAHLLGVDLAQGMVAHACAATPQGEFFVGSAETLPFQDASIDLILSTVSFHHWENHGQGLRMVGRVLRPGGRFYLADTLVPGWLTKIYHHGTMVQPEQLKAMFIQAGLEVLSQKPLLGWYFYLSVGEKDSP